ncbi:MAG: PKD domain-containing protein [Actinobacteria bacterium]|nr:PKD domain-containing protein [Actinomycetota bacterium]
MVYSLLDGTDDGDDGGGSTNEPPSATFTADCTDLNCDFDGSGSSDSDGSITSYEWDFGDDNTATGATVSHTYEADGTYSVTLTVTDDEGATDSAVQEVTVSDSSDDGGGEVGDNVPVVDSFTVSTRTSGPWFRAETSWAVSDEDGDLDTVVIEMLDGTTVVDSATIGVSGSSASGDTEVRTRGSADSVRITVTDGNGNSVSDTKDDI